jgi:hypothetical protein
MAEEPLTARIHQRQEATTTPDQATPAWRTIGRTGSRDLRERGQTDEHIVAGEPTIPTQEASMSGALTIGHRILPRINR